MADANKVNYKNPMEIIVYTQNGPRRVKNTNYDSKKCEKCGKKHKFLQLLCRKEDLK